MLWTTPDKYYHAEVTCDLFGRKCIKKTWGGRFNRLGSHSTDYFDSDDRIGVEMAKIERVRVKRGYFQAS